MSEGFAVSTYVENNHMIQLDDHRLMYLFIPLSLGLGINVDVFTKCVKSRILGVFEFVSMGRKCYRSI
jgi:hypothetical protein